MSFEEYVVMSECLVPIVAPIVLGVFVFGIFIYYSNKPNIENIPEILNIPDITPPITEEGINALQSLIKDDVGQALLNSYRLLVACTWGCIEETEEEMVSRVSYDPAWQELLQYIARHNTFTDVPQIIETPPIVEIEAPSNSNIFLDFIYSDFGFKCMIAGSAIVVTVILAHILIKWYFKTSYTAIAKKSVLLIKGYYNSVMSAKIAKTSYYTSKFKFK
jgi:hypothetical protein